MIKRIFQKLRELLHSLRIRFIVVFLLSVSLGVGGYFLVHYFSYDYINGVYSSNEHKKERELSYIKDLQEFVERNEISSENTAKLSEWARENKYVYLIIYKDNELFYTSDDQPKEPPAEDETENPSDDETENPSDDESENPDSTEDGPTEPPDENPDGSEENPDGDSTENPDGNPSETPDTDSGEGGEDGKNGTSEDDKKPDDDKEPSNKDPGGVTIDYPTREELFEYARQNDLHTLELADGTMFASLTEFTEYLYYDISNIVSIIFALFVVLVILTFYFHMVTTRIIRLGNEVNKVADGDTGHVIRAKGNDEISKLSVNVENMRASMIENFEKEREAIDANNALITSMSHDIRTPLTVLLGYIDVMQSRSQGNSEMEDYLKAAESTALRLKKLSDDMFSYFLVFGAKELEIDMESYDAATLIDQMLFEHITLMRESGYAVDFVGLDYECLSGTEIRTDAQKLIRIFDNVFSNVYKYAEKTEKVSIETAISDGEIVLRFVNKVALLTSKAESNGIGLKTCKKLGEYIGADFGYEFVGENFVATLKLKLEKNTDR